MKAIFYWVIFYVAPRPPPFAAAKRVLSVSSYHYSYYFPAFRDNKFLVGFPP
jgi:hypothetical protein